MLYASGTKQYTGWGGGGGGGGGGGLEEGGLQETCFTETGHTWEIGRSNISVNNVEKHFHSHT